MPIAPPTRCGEQGCYEMATNGGRCDDHQRPPWQRRSRAWAGGSTRAWRTFRAKQLKAEWACRHCGAQATEVDHITPLSEGGSKWDRANVQSLCKACHETKTRADAAARVARRRAERADL